MLNVSTLKVGDRVGYGRSGNWGGIHSHGFATVTKINGHGHITLDNGKVFTKHGDEYKGSQYSSPSLWAAADLEAYLAREELNRSVNKAVEALKEALNGHRNGCGQHHVSEAYKAELAALVAALPVNYTES